ncbi:MAG TPA: DUF2911 domain-containing protein [Cytophagales bacterium]|nr:DUF2911 domain-containing protein [Cytophagales bacterium]
MKKNFQLLLLSLFISSISMGQGLKLPSPSPTQTIKQEFALSEVSITYSRPSAKGRVIFGDLVKYDTIWRTGANSSTKITFGDDVKINGKGVPAGQYALFTRPGKSEWEIILSKNLETWGSMGYKPDADFMRFKVKSSSIPEHVETFTILFSNVKPASMDIQLVWEKTAVSFTISAEIDSEIMANIEEAMKGEKKPYFQAAAYYYETNRDLPKALEWVNEAVKGEPKAYWVEHLKAKIQYKLQDFKGAIASAESSKGKAKEQGNPDYVALNEKLIAEAKKAK